MGTVIDLWREGTIIQALIALVLVVTVCYMYATGATPPSELLGLLTLVLGFYFGAKTQSAAYKINGAASAFKAMAEASGGTAAVPGAGAYRGDSDATRAKRG